jgi:hypothetical protein
MPALSDFAAGALVEAIAITTLPGHVGARPASRRRARRNGLHQDYRSHANCIGDPRLVASECGSDGVLLLQCTSLL